MDILNTDKMKVKELRKLVREIIKEALAEGNALVSTKSGTKSISFSNPSELNALKTDSNVSSITTTDGQKLKEMARIAKGYRLANDNVNTALYQNKRISGVPLSDIIRYIGENPGTDKKDVQTHFNFVRPQIANAIINTLQDSGIIVKLGPGGEPETSAANGSVTPVTASDIEDMFVGDVDPLPLYFGDEETPEEEPEDSEIKKIKPSKSRMSDEDYEAWDKYTDLKQRLDATKSNILKLNRDKNPSVPGDIKDKPSNELIRLRDLRKSLEDRIKELISNSPYLQQKTGKIFQPTEEPITEPEEPEETEDEATLDEYYMRKAQYYAGIIK